MLNGKRIHFIGVAGTGMSALAYICAEKGYEVSGSDIQENISTIRLKSKGVKIYRGHSPEHINDVDVIVVSSAIPPDNEEYVYAKSKNIPILHRSDLLAELTKEKKSIIVGGAHGKTTTTSMIALVLENNKTDPTIIVGGELEDIGGNAKLGSGEYLVAEGDESDGSILKLNPYILVVTNIDNDHLDYYENIENIKSTFLKVIEKVPEDGYVLLNLDCKNIRDIIGKIKDKKYYTYGFSNADFTADNIVLNSSGSEFDVYFRNVKLGRVKLKVPGRHNILNSLSAIGISYILGLDFEQTIKALEKFHGVQRRIQFKGVIENDVLVFDDYGHHPTEILATLETLRLYNRRLVVVFQPHRYTRTYFLSKEIADALSLSDVVILMEIYSAGEKPIPGVSSRNIYDEIKKKYPELEIYLVNDIVEAATKVKSVLRDGDLLLTLGAGNVWKVGEALLAQGKKDVNVEYSQ
ncbi:UDP-N-acetylmuramate--L-alanine ligase [Dictyoglomus thermophilum]|uniref:UDP-N-acetylmuramate--L-alanine ligase n=1 Tax=Dictyoglomus thermophilum TaxID=14 RepID=UPI0011EB67CC|nr:UDP-N-acetylmuramate--L-alanine ligase [Dictyoglomus thermophilum]TYT21197.1 UDP-N-acetylmuramate--L-alanine ligase [Dictyoglomus thermophilum]